MIQWIPENEGGKLESLDPGAMSVTTTFGDTFKGDVINFIPYQKAADLVENAGLTNKDGWCDVDQGTFESKVVKGIHIIGDSCVAGAMPKSGHSAASQAKNCAAVIVSRLAGQEPPEPTYANTCYSFISPDFGISVAAVYRLQDGAITRVAGGVTPPYPEEKDRFYKNEAKYTRGWYKSITSEAWGTS